MELQLTICPECGAPAETTDEGHVDSTDGPVRVVRVRCVRRHWFLLAADDLASSNAYLRTPAASGVPSTPASGSLPHAGRAAASGIVHEARGR
jgi:hypothetical protein